MGWTIVTTSNEAHAQAAETVEKAIIQYLDSQETKPARISAIDDLIHLLNFERRLAMLDEKQIFAMQCHPSQEMTDSLNACKSEKDREELIESASIVLYFRRCAWTEYLNGTSKYCPCPPADVEKDDKMVNIEKDAALTIAAPIVDQDRLQHQP
jgi:hypothetical protein